eukprot:g15240.t1
MLLVGVHEESQTCEEADPSLQALLRVLLQELSNVRSDAATVAAGGSPCHWSSWRAEPVAMAPPVNIPQADLAEPMTSGRPPLFVCPHLTGDVTFGQTETLLHVTLPFGLAERKNICNTYLTDEKVIQSRTA